MESRAIKFRAYYKEGYGSKMVYDLTPNTWSRQIPSNAEDCMVFMQCTGLQDKNRIDIYDRDILSDGNTIYKVDWNQQNGKWCIDPIKSLIGEDWIILSLGYNQLGNGYYHREDLEIIGNEFLNPELL